MKFIIKYGTKKYFLFVIIGLMISGIEGFLFPATIRIIVDSLNVGNINGLALGISFGIIGYITLGFGSYFYQLSLARLISTFNVNIKSLIYKNYLDNFYKKSKKNSSEILSFIQNDLKLLESNYIMAYITSLQTIVLASVSTIYVALTNLSLALLFIVFAFLPMILPRFTQKQIEDSASIWTINNEEYTKELTENIKGAPTIKSYGREETFFERLKIKVLLSEESNVNMTKTQAFSNIMAYVLSNVSRLIPLFIGGLFVLQNRIELGALLSIFMASDRIANPLTVAVQNYNKISTTNGIRAKINKIAFETIANFDKSSPSNEILPIKIKNISLNYETDKIILDNISMIINKGDKILIKGESGSGKTTFLRMLLGILSPFSGEINYGKKDKIIGPKITQSISYIRQTPIIFDDTIEFNITLGESFSKDRIVKAINDAGLVDLVNEEGLNYLVGENGENLSGGQNQRIEIARAVLRDRQLLIADEVTASLDNRTSQGIRNTLFSLPQTVIEVSHHVDSQDLSRYDYIYQIIDKKMRKEMFPLV